MKGATRLVLTNNMHFLISIHAPVKGATVNGWTFGVMSKISIHAPVKGATTMLIVIMGMKIFQSTHP